MADAVTGLPRRVALVAVDAADAVDCLLSDFAEALPVYARLSGMDAPELVRADGADMPGDCDTVLLGALFDARGGNGRLADALRPCAPGTRVYALGATDARDPGCAGPALDTLASLCEELGLSWMGGVVVGRAALFPRVMGCPRMGWARRPASEAVDRLIAAVRSGLPADEELVRPSPWARVLALVR